MTPFFSLITPTLQRESLRICCESVDAQTFKDWEHLIFIDGYPPQNWNADLWLCDNRMFLSNGFSYKNFGNTPRHLAWKMATGKYVLYLDDDNYLADPDILRDIHSTITAAGEPPVCIFPILRHGQRFFSLPPRTCLVDTANLVVKRDVGQWPNRNEYTLDGIFIESLVAEHGYTGFEGMRSIVVMPVSSEGK